MSSYSDFDTYARCPMMSKYKNVWNLQPVRKAASLHEGSAQHKVQEVALILHREGKLDPLELTKALGPIMDEGRELRFPAEQAEYEALFALCQRRFWRWFEFYDRLERWDILHIEEQFTIVADGVEITCTPDLVIRDRYTQAVWVVDLKSAATVPETDTPTLQTYINLAAVKAVYPEAAGFMFDYLRKKEPREPALIKDGSRIGDLKRIDTDYATLVQFCQDVKPELLDTPEVKERLAELRVSDQDKWFKRFPFHVSDETLSNALDDVVRESKVMQFVQDNNLWYRVVIKSGGYRDCVKCGYKTICDAELTGGDLERTKAQFYEPRDLSYKEYDIEEEGT